MGLNRFSKLADIGPQATGLRLVGAMNYATSTGEVRLELEDLAGII